MRWTDRAVRAALGLSGPASDAVYSGISTDTRSIAPGALFVALTGERFDAHDFLPGANAAGATGAVVRRGTAPVPGLTLYPVEDTGRALGDLAHARRKTITGPVIAITGTNGKTSTKEMVAQALRTRYRTWATRLNRNNLIGVPLTMLEAPADTEALVIEAGASLPGEMARHREVIEPSIAVITNVTAGHLEGFGGGEGVLTEKLSLLDGVPLALVGTEPQGLAELARQRARKVITAGLRDADRMPIRVEMTPDGRPRVSVAGQRFLLDARGKHQAGNAMLAWAVAEAVGLDPVRVARSLEALELPGGRGELSHHGRLTVLHDAYNANPASFRTAIAIAQAMRQGRRLVFIAGSMRELGKDSRRFHHEIAGELAALNPELLGVVGDFVLAIKPHAEVLGERLLRASDPMALGPLLKERLKGDELVVLKASRGVQLERILPFLGVAIETH